MGNRLLSDLLIDVESPEEHDYATPYRVRVTCPHGKTPMTWTRTCGDGCHKDVFKRGDCHKVNPSLEDVRHAAVVQHAKRHGCSCCSIYWTEFGPIHDASRATSEAAHAGCTHSPFYVNEGPVTGETREQLLASIRIERRYRRR